METETNREVEIPINIPLTITRPSESELLLSLKNHAPDCEIPSSSYSCFAVQALDEQHRDSVTLSKPELQDHPFWQRWERFSSSVSNLERTTLQKLKKAAKGRQNSKDILTKLEAIQSARDEKIYRAWEVVLIEWTSLLRLRSKYVHLDKLNELSEPEEGKSIEQLEKEIRCLEVEISEHEVKLEQQWEQIKRAEEDLETRRATLRQAEIRNREVESKSREERIQSLMSLLASLRGMNRGLIKQWLDNESHI